ncbi:MAG: bifunctional oligoribonuclease/PAP phosphatase NrnA [Clostridia bacterium]|nr:bifunctional oligoribonuclease/PAP phosphatase NrnA [Clostridia bacterium]
MRIKNNVIEALQNSQNVAIFIHTRPDADCIGSASALKICLEELGKEVDIYCDSEIQSCYQYIKHSNIINYPSKIIEYDTCVALDCSDIYRLGKYSTMFEAAETTVKIDHHATGTDFAKVNFVKNVSSTGEIIYYIFKALKVKVNHDAANSLYSAIASDTNCFMNMNTTPDAHKIAYELFKIGFNFDKANYFLFKRKTLGQVEMQKIALNHIRFFLDKRVAITYLKMEDFEKCYISNNETFALVDTCINIQNVEIGIMISEIKPNLYACSIRGKGRIDVSKVASAFGGGGHLQAAGCNIFGSYKTVMNKLVKNCRKVLC